MKAIYLTEDDARIITGVLKEWRSRNRGLTPSEPIHPYGVEESPGTPPDDLLASEVYVVEVPPEGIPGMKLEGDKHVPGKAECKVHRLWPLAQTGTGTGTETKSEEYLKELHFKHEVHNLGGDIDGGGGETGTGTGGKTNDFRLAWRTKFGRWFIEQRKTLVELCSLQTAQRNEFYQALKGTWDPETCKWSYEDAETVYAIDHRMGPPQAKAGWKGLYEEKPSNKVDHKGRVFVCVSLDCEEETGTGT